MRPVPRYEDRTIYGDVEAKVGASVVQLSARSPGKIEFHKGEAQAILTDLSGFGNRCQHLIFELARAAGISDLSARTPRSRNKMNVVKAAFEAMMSQRLPEDVARARGKKMVDVRKVYYGGKVY
jgi:small subunit ribosomal protein S5